MIQTRSAREFQRMRRRRNKAEYDHIIIGHADLTTDLTHAQAIIDAVRHVGTAAFLLPALERAGVTVETVTRRFYVEACAALDVAVSDRAVGHGTSRK